MMDEVPTSNHSPAPIRGGTVEPAKPSALAKRHSQPPHPAPAPAPAERFELRDPFFEVTHRRATFDEMRAKADQSGASRFTAIDAAGSRTPIQKVNGDWQRGTPLPPLLQRPLDPIAARDEVPDASVEQQPGQSAQKHTASEKAADKAIAKADALAERAAMLARIENALTERYVIRRAPARVGDMHIGSTEYRFRGDSSRVAFTESTFRLATDTNSPSVARSMVDLAQARDWKGLRVSGAEDFRRLVWLEANVRGVKALGYEPTPADLELLRREREARQSNRIEPAHHTGDAEASLAGTKASSRGGSQKVVVAAIEAVLVAKKVPEAKRLAVLAAAAEQLATLPHSAAVPKIKVYDRSAPRQVPPMVPTPDRHHAPDRAPPARSR